MKRTIAVILLMIFTSHAYCLRSASEELLDAIATCPEPNNPYSNGLIPLNGNSFRNVTLTLIGEVDQYTNAMLIKSEIIYDPRIKNSLSGLPVRKVGSFELLVGRWSKRPLAGTSQRCDLRIHP